MEIYLSKILLFIFLTLNIWAQDLVNIYRSEGLSAVEKLLREKLKDDNYWLEYLNNKVVDFGYFETKKYIIVTKKDQTELSLYKNENNNLELLSRDNVIVGENDGDKLVEGDKKTPVGVYELTEKKSNLDPFYGPFALVTSYPNTFDKTLNKNGSGIWIHGMPLNEDREKFTKGCIALDNTQLEDLDKKIDINSSLLITSQSEIKKATKEELATILSSIFKWRDAWKVSDIEEYLKYYSNEFKRFDGMEFEQFADYKRRIFSKDESKIIKLYNIDIAVYPNSLNKNMFKVSMDEEYYSPAVKFIGKKELFLELVDNQVKILAEG